MRATPSSASRGTVRPGRKSTFSGAASASTNASISPRRVTPGTKIAVRAGVDVALGALERVVEVAVAEPVRVGAGVDEQVRRRGLTAAITAAQWAGSPCRSSRLTPATGRAGRRTPATSAGSSEKPCSMSTVIGQSEVGEPVRELDRLLRGRPPRRRVARARRRRRGSSSRPPRTPRRRAPRPDTWSQAFGSSERVAGPVQVREGAHRSASDERAGVPLARAAPRARAERAPGEIDEDGPPSGADARVTGTGTVFPADERRRRLARLHEHRRRAAATSSSGRRAGGSVEQPRRAPRPRRVRRCAGW